MVDLLKTLHAAADIAEAKLANVTAEGESVGRQITALAAALSLNEKAEYEEWLAARAAAAAKKAAAAAARA